MIKQNNKIIVVLGSTATGKSDLAVQIAKKFNGEIISSDSRQIYKKLNIGSNKITKKEQRGIKHHLLDIAEPNEEFTLYDWQKKCFQTINKILKKKKLPIIAGGTGLYISSILQNYQIPKANSQLRKELNKKSLKELTEKLKEVDKHSFKKIDTKNKRKVIRALEYSLSFNNSLIKEQKTTECPYEYLVLGLDMPREILYKKINKRVNQMMKIGLLREVKKINKKYKDNNYPSLSGIGYKEIIMYLNKKIDLLEAIELIKKNTRNYAKRQKTWFRRMEKQGIKIDWNKSFPQTVKLITNFIK